MPTSTLVHLASQPRLGSFWGSMAACQGHLMTPAVMLLCQKTARMRGFLGVKGPPSSLRGWPHENEGSGKEVNNHIHVENGVSWPHPSFLNRNLELKRTSLMPESSGSRKAYWEAPGRCMACSRCPTGLRGICVAMPNGWSSALGVPVKTFLDAMRPSLGKEWNPFCN